MGSVLLREVKSEIRIIGWDDTPFTFKDKRVLLIGVVFRGGNYMDGMLVTKIQVDGRDSTEKIIKAIKKSSHYEQLRIIMLDGITFGGFNIVDMEKIFNSTKLPVIAITRKNPDLESMKRALKRFDDFDYRWSLIEKAGKVYPLKIKRFRGKEIETKEIYYQKMGIEKEDVEKIIKISSTHAFIPEPLRIAHIIASGFKGVKLLN